MKSKAVRFTDEELAKVEKFLKSNPLFDFSKLARMAISAFIENPTITINPIPKNSDDAPREEING